VTALRQRRTGPVGRGFTLIELLVTLALVGLVALTALPLYEVTMTRIKESELRAALRSLRGAIDAYKSAVDQGLVKVDAGNSGYPPSLQTLVDGVDAGLTDAKTLSGGQDLTKRMVFLRRIPRDPFFADPNAPAEATWLLRAYASPPDNPRPGADVFDVLSTSTRLGLNGTAYNTW
jgi:general secretion pathway protein G